MFGRKEHITSEEELQKAMQELKKGSAEAFHLLYEKYYQKIYRFCLRMLNDKAAAEDAFQETFIKVYEHRKDFRGNNFAAWLFAIARHTCLNELRQRKEYNSLEDDNQTAYVVNQSDIGMQDFINKQLNKLPIALREALILREYEDCSYQDIADILGIDLSLAKIRVHRARIILRKLLQPIVKELYET